jgi:ketosteroid isomerase-like protein
MDSRWLRSPRPPTVRSAGSWELRARLRIPSIWATSACAALAVSTSARTTPLCLPGAADEDQIRAVIADRAAAMRERDAERFVAHYAPKVVRFDLAPPLASKGSEARDAEALRAWFASHPGGPVGYEIRDLTVTADGDVAFCHSLNQLGGALWFRSTIGLRRIGGDWRITHEHNSTPFYMDGSDKAALDLQP